MGGVWESASLEVARRTLAWCRDLIEEWKRRVGNDGTLKALGCIYLNLKRLEAECGVAVGGDEAMAYGSVVDLLHQEMEDALKEAKVWRCGKKHCVDCDDDIERRTRCYNSSGEVRVARRRKHNIVPFGHRPLAAITTCATYTLPVPGRTAVTRKAVVRRRGKRPCVRKAVKRRRQ